MKMHPSQQRYAQFRLDERKRMLGDEYMPLTEALALVPLVRADQWIKRANLGPIRLHNGRKESHLKVIVYAVVKQQFAESLKELKEKSSEQRQRETYRQTWNCKKAGNANGFIYALIDPANDLPCYIGQTTSSPQSRLTDHFRDLNRGNHYNNHLQNLFNERRHLGFDEMQAIIVEHVTDGKINDREIFWIAEAARCGVRLCNLTTGGERPEPSVETRARIATVAATKWRDPEYQRRHKESLDARFGPAREARRKAREPYARKVEEWRASRIKKQEESSLRKSLTFVTVNGTIAVIPLTQGKRALIDAADVPIVGGHSWHAHWKRFKHYDGYWRAKTTGKKKGTLLLSRLIMGASDTSMVHPVNGNHLDCRRNNLSIRRKNSFL